MNPFDTPWIVSILIVLFLVILGVREFGSAQRVPKHLPERGLGFFHSGILFAIAVALVLGTGVLFTHVVELETLLPLYPHARYAPEREAFTAKGVWVFVSHDSRDLILEYYKNSADRLGYTLSSDVSSSTTRLLISKDVVRVFLTIVQEESAQVLYYSEAGDVRTVEVPLL